MGKRRYHSNHLIVLQPMLQFKLIITNAGVGIFDLYNTMKYILPIFPLIQR